MKKSENMQYHFIEIFKRIFFHVSLKRKRQFWFLLVGMAIVGAIETLTAGVVALFIATVSDPEAVLRYSYIVKLQRLLGSKFLFNTQNLILIISFVTVTFMALQVFARLAINFFVSLYSAYVSNYIGEKLLYGFLFVPYEWILSRNTADFIQSIQLRTQVAQFLKGALRALSDIVVVIMMLFSLLVIAPLFSLITISIVFILSYFIFSGTRKYLDRISAKVKDYLFFINREVHKSMLGIKDIKVTNREYLFVRNYNQPAYHHGRLIAIQELLSQSPRLLLELMGVFLMAAAVCCMFLFYNKTSVRITGMLALFAAVGWRVLPAVTRIIHGFSLLRVSLPYVQLILDYLKEIGPQGKQQLQAPSSEYQQFNFQAKISFKNVDFHYNGYDNHVLKGLSFNILKGQTIGIIGASGAGKSTFIDLFIGLLAPTAGEITVDGISLKEGYAREWMRDIGYVPQSPYTCVGTVAENIAFGFTGKKIDRERVLQCCSLAAMDDFLCNLPEGIDSQIGERGVKLSGGQQQRVSIARALYHSPQVLVFDEATSSLDTKSEKSIQKTIYSLKRSHTLIIIAHRLSTVEECDKVIWLQNGCARLIDAPEIVLPQYRKVMKTEKPAVAI